MIKFENTEIFGLKAALRGMRNPKNSWSESDSIATTDCETGDEKCMESRKDAGVCIGKKDMHLAEVLANAGTDHGKYLRMIAVYVDITAPFYWWKEFDTYKVGTVANSCSTMHKIHSKEFTLKDFSTDHLDKESLKLLNALIDYLNVMRDCYNNAISESDTDWANHYWWQMIQMLPSSYNQRRTIMLNYAVLRNMYHSRKAHKLTEWHLLCDWIKTLPYNHLITGEAYRSPRTQIKDVYFIDDVIQCFDAEDPYVRI